MTVTLNLEPQVERRVRSAAEALGVTIEAYLVSLIAGTLLPPPAEPGSLEEFEAALDTFSEGLDHLPVLPPEATTRESIYAEHD